MFVMMNEIQTTEGGQKRSLLTTGDQIYLKTTTKKTDFIHRNFTKGWLKIDAM